MKRGALGWPEQHMVVVVTQWRAGFFDRAKQADMDKQPNAWAHLSGISNTVQAVLC